MENFQYEISVILRLITSLGMGFLIGLEREYAEKSAGLRTYMLITIGTTVISMLGIDIVNYFIKNISSESIKVDPTRVIQAIIVGISFLGAGCIIKDQSKFQAKNLTTAASILVCSGIGIAVGIEKYFFAIAVTIIVLIINRGFICVERLWHRLLSKE